MLNINLGHNQNLMDSCRKLYEYAFLIEQIRLGLAEGRIESQNFALLTAQLINDSRINDLKGAADDESFRRTLFREYKIETE